MTHNTKGLHNGQKQILPTLSFSENRRKTAKTGKIHISGLAGRMTFVYGAIEPETYVSYLCFISYTPLRPTEIRKNGKNGEKRQKTAKSVSQDWLVV